MGLIAGCRNGTLQQVYFSDVLIWQSVNQVGILFYIWILFYIRSDGKLAFETSQKLENPLKISTTDK